ncbi:hypothetical protein FOD75_07695 [Limosilactobacillus reuteri]|uniref:Uncharacterized protein n=1 Tax=Limosilactobacillus reuteri TaxID=1598 RepID=A0A517D6G5_LIMRT|nr:hypothetical protein [Limosilactobacillus reuteri]QDR72951.1 hypothetical protein FOD75_07695 [Limosilactobacillus reuteri]
MGTYPDVNIAYFSFQNKINKEANSPNPDTQIFLDENGSIDFYLRCSVNFGTVFQSLLENSNWYLYLTVLSEESGLEEQIYLDQIFGPIPSQSGSVSFEVGFPIKIDGKLIKRNNIKSLDIELSVSPRTDEDPDFNQSVKEGCFFKTILPIWSN